MQCLSGRISWNLRTMSTSASPTLHKFFVYAPDKTDPDAFARRLSVRSKHLEGAKKAIADGSIREPSTRNGHPSVDFRSAGVGGALLTPESLLSDDKKMVGIFLARRDAIHSLIFRSALRSSLRPKISKQ
jgi:hypothetical protein